MKAASAARGVALALTALLSPGASADDSLGAFADDLVQGDAGWEARAQGARDAEPRREPILRAIEAYERALAARPESLEARWKLLRALHFAGEFVPGSDAERRKHFERGTEVSEEGLKRLRKRLEVESLDGLSPEALGARVDGTGLERPPVARLHFWSSIHWGAWSQQVGLLSAVRQGVAERMHRYTRVSIALEPGYEEGGALRLLGRLHAELPRVPWVSGWVDRERAIPLVERAHELAPENPGNRLLLGLTLLDLAPARRAEATRLLRQVAELTPRPEMRIEDLAMREQARERLATG